MGATLTDRERLVLALDELHHTHRYWTANTADLICCGTCLAHQMIEGKNDTGAGGAVGWHVQADETAFGHGFHAIDWPDVPRADVPACDRCTLLNDELELMPDDDDISHDQWQAAQYAHILADHHRLLGPLALFVLGDVDVVMAVLRRHGLGAGPAPYEGTDGWVYVTAPPLRAVS